MTNTTNIDCSTVGPFDVLCGRDKESYNNIGNRRFRIMININLPKYMKCKTRPDRSKMILRLTNELREPCGKFRFLKRTKMTDDNGTDCSTLVVFDRHQSREKIAHALRDAAAQQKSMKKKRAIQRSMELKLMSQTNHVLTDMACEKDKLRKALECSMDLKNMSSTNHTVSDMAREKDILRNENHRNEQFPHRFTTLLDRTAGLKLMPSTNHVLSDLAGEKDKMRGSDYGKYRPPVDVVEIQQDRKLDLEALLQEKRARLADILLDCDTSILEPTPI